MNCKYCNAELVEGQPFCPSCGKNQDEENSVVETVEATETAEQENAVTAEEAASEEHALPSETTNEQPAEPEIKEGIKATPGKIALAVVAIIAVAAVLISLIFKNEQPGATDPTVAPTEEVVEVTMPSDGDPESALCKASYTVSDEEAEKTADVVVATVGDKGLTNGQLQAFYWQEVYLFMQEYGNYLPYIGLDLSVPMDKQLTEMGGSPMSWQQFFLDSAVYSWHNYQSMALEAEAEGYELPENRQMELDTLPAELEASSMEGGFESIDAMIRKSVGAACDLESYLEYVDVYYHGLSYYYDYCDALTATDEEVEAYYAENETQYIENGITKDAKYVDVRHVLLQPEGGETGADGYPVYTDEAWEACRIKVEEIYNKWQTGDKSEESFAQLAMDHSVDGNAADGGLYENVRVGQMVESFQNWCFDDARQTGDHGLVKTPYGYHIMFFCASHPVQYADVRNVLLQPEGGEIGEDGYPAYTDEAWEACRQKAEELYNQWMAGDKSEESFVQLATDHSESDNATVGGMNQSIGLGQMDEDFENWCFDENRQIGDCGLIKTPYGYQILFLSDMRPAWYQNAKFDMLNEHAYDLIPAMMEKYPMTIDYNLVALGNLNMA